VCKRNGINCIPAFEIMHRGIDMGTGMGAHREIAYQVHPMIRLPEPGCLVTWIHYCIGRQRAGYIKDLHSSHTPAEFSNQWDEPDTAMPLPRDSTALFFYHNQFLDVPAANRGDESSPISKLVDKRRWYLRS